MTQKVYFHLLIRTQLRLSNLSVNCPFIKVWGLPSLSITVGSEVEKPIRRNQLPSLVIDINFLIE